MEIIDKDLVPFVNFGWVKNIKNMGPRSHLDNIMAVDQEIWKLLEVLRVCQPFKPQIHYCRETKNQKSIFSPHSGEFEINSLILYQLKFVEMNKVELLKMLEEKLGKEIKYDSDLGVLSQAMLDELGETVSHNTLRRMFKEDVVRNHRSSTNDILAHYLGYKSYDLLLKDCGPDADISVYTPVDSIDVENLQQGSQVQFTWEPGRMILAFYMGNFKFIVNDVIGSKNIQKGDVLEISQLAVGFELYVVNVERNGENLGAYHAAKQGGLTSIEIIG